MENTLDWIKSNPLTVVSIVVIVAALGAFWWISSQASMLAEDMKKRASVMGRVEGAMSTSVQVPPAQVAGEPRQMSVTINPPNIDALKQVYEQMYTEYEQMLQMAIHHNRKEHDPIIPGLFPDPVTEDLPFKARDEYLETLEQFYAMMDAGMPPKPEKIAKTLQQAKQRYASSMMIGAAPNVQPLEQLDSMQNQSALAQKQAQALIQLYKQHAKQIHVYAQRPKFDLAAGIWQEGVFHVGKWAQQSTRPSMAQLWEAQMRTWITKDLVRVIRRVNNVGEEDVSVVEAPVKRILSIKVRPGYIGVVPPASMGSMAMMGSTSAMSSTSTSMTMTSSSDGEIEPKFMLSPTGRHSNPLYDVRHVVLEVLVDGSRLPKLLNAINQVNFMTVLGMQTAEVNEYKQLQQGFYYGEGADVLQVKMIIETLWLRQWTKKLMPDKVRKYLGIPPREEEEEESGAASGGAGASSAYGF